MDKSQIKRDEIVEKVTSLIEDMEYNDITVRLICEVTDISIGTFYHYFKNKEDILKVILSRVDNYIIDKIEPQLTHENEFDNLKLFMVGFAQETKITSRGAGRVISTASVPLPYTDEMLEEERERALYKVPTEIIRRGKMKGQIAQEVDEHFIVRALIMNLRGCAMDWSRRRCSYDIEEYVEQYFEVFKKVLL